MSNKKTVNKTGSLFSLFIITIALFFCFSSCTSCARKTITWESDYKTAVSIAEENNKPIFLVYTGAIWDEQSVNLKKNILNSNVFLEHVSKNYILLNINIPENTGTIPEEIAMQKANLAQSMSIEELPAIILLTKTGIPYEQLDTGEFTNNPEEMLSLLDTKKDITKKFINLENSIAKNEGIEKATAIDALYTATPEQYQATYMRAYLNQIPLLDPANETKLYNKYSLQLTYSEMQEFLEKADYNRCITFLVNKLNESADLFTKESKQILYLNLADFATKAKKSNEEILEYLQSSYEADPDSKYAAELLNYIQQFATNPLETTEGVK